MIKHFCDICKNEMTERIRVSITAKEVDEEGYFRTVGENLMGTDYEFCGECYNKLVDIVGAIGQEESLEFVDGSNSNNNNSQQTQATPTQNTTAASVEAANTIFDKLRNLIKRGRKNDDRA